MSQNKTVVPGIGDVDHSGDSRRNNVGNDFYSRGTSRMSSGNPRGTIVPGMNAVAGNPNTIRQENPQNRKSHDPVIGFLYSISRQGFGEYWPVHVGRNTIGRDTNNDVILAEYTVSGLHATLSVRKMKTNGKVIALIRDEGSKTGLLVNGEELGYEGHECFNGDIITVGCNYTLLLILVNAEEVGLSIAEHFEDALVEEEEEMPIPVPPMNQGRPTFNPYDHNNRSTIAMDGSVGEEPGGTKFM
ncbi:FHA domain-containing protein [Parabacteroides sp.]